VCVRVVCAYWHCVGLVGEWVGVCVEMKNGQRRVCHFYDDPFL
jgi:hypothetical protein